MSVLTGTLWGSSPGSRERDRLSPRGRVRWYERPRYRNPAWACVSVAMVAGGLWLAGAFWRYAQGIDSTSVLVWLLVTFVAFLPVIVAMAGCALPVLVAMRFRDRVFRKYREEPGRGERLVVWGWALSQLLVLNAVMLYVLVQIR